MNEIKVEKEGACKVGGRGRNNGRGGYRLDKPFMPKTPEFEVGCDTLEGFIFDCSDLKQTDLYNSTMKEIIGYVGREYSNGGEIKSTIENKKLLPNHPSERDGARRLCKAHLGTSAGLVCPPRQSYHLQLTVCIYPYAWRVHRHHGCEPQGTERIRENEREL
jgi:hypothetical protein